MIRESQNLTRDVWYDRHTRLWVAQWKDSEGNQVGEAEYSHVKPKSKPAQSTQPASKSRKGMR